MLDNAPSSKRLRTGIAIVLASLAFTLWGFFWYATLLDDVWQSLIGRTEDELISMAAARGHSQTILTYLISAVQVIGLSFLFRTTRAKHFWDYQRIAAIVSIMIALPVLGNAVLFEGASTLLWGLDFTHFILGYAGIALVFFIVDNLWSTDTFP